MKQEDLDWLVYHQLPEGAPVTPATIAAQCGLALPEVDASLARLERACLVERTADSVRLLSFGEALIRNQIQYEKDLPFTIENGVIRARKQEPCRNTK